MSMTEAFHISEDDLIQYALGTLREAQLGTMTAHISLCNQCRGELAKVHLDLASLANTVPMSNPPVAARERFLNKISSDAAPASKFVQMRDNNKLFLVSRSFHSWLASPLPLKILSGALAAALLFTAYDDFSHIHQIRQMQPALRRNERDLAQLTELKEFLKGTNAQQVSLHEKPQITKAPEGHTLYSAATGKLIFTASNMPLPPAGKAYELWVLPVRGGAPVPAGMFTPDLQGNAAIVFPDIPTNIQAAGFGVTLEKAEGSPTPTSPILISGT